MASIWFFNSPPQYCLLSRWFFPDPKKVLWVSDSLHIVHNESSHLTRGPGSGLLSLLFWPLSMMLIVAPLRQKMFLLSPKSCFALKYLICLISLILLPLFPMTDPTTSLGTDISCLNFGSVFNVIKKWIFCERQHLCSFCSKDMSDLRSRSLLSSLLDLPPPPPVDLRAKSAIASNGELRST